MVPRAASAPAAAGTLARRPAVLIDLAFTGSLSLLRPAVQLPLGACRFLMEAQAGAPVLQPYAVRTAIPLAGTPLKPPYDVSKLMWNERRTRNDKRQYSYSGSNKEKVSSLRCSHCQQWFYLDEINGPELVPVGFLAHQRNYRFSCAWCCSHAWGNGCGGRHEPKSTDPSWVERFELTKPKKYEAIVDAFLNLMASAQPRRKEFKVSEIKDYLLAHWDPLLPGWERPRELTGEGKPFDIAPYFNKKGEFSQVRKPYWQLTDRRPFQPFEMLLPHESWCIPGLSVSDGGDSPESARVQPATGSISVQSAQSDSVRDTARVSDEGKVSVGHSMSTSAEAGAHAGGDPPLAVDNVNDAGGSNAEPAYLSDGIGGHELYTYREPTDGKRSVRHETARSGDNAPAKRLRSVQDQWLHAQEQPVSTPADALADVCLSKLANPRVVALAATTRQPQPQVRSGQDCKTADATVNASGRRVTLHQQMRDENLVPAWLPHGMPTLARQQYEAEHRRLQALLQSPEVMLKEHPLSEASLLKQSFHPLNCSSTALKMPGMAIESGCGGLLPVGPAVSELVPTSIHNQKAKPHHAHHGNRRYAL